MGVMKALKAETCYPGKERHAVPCRALREAAAALTARAAKAQDGADLTTHAWR